MSPSDRSRQSSSQARLTSLPLELLELVASHLAGRDIRSLRLTCTSLQDLVRLRLDRVFLSPNPRNIEVFKAIARHEAYRHQVVEIIYDDARFPDPPDSTPDWVAGIQSAGTGSERKVADQNPKGVAPWYFTQHERLVKKLESRLTADNEERPDLPARRAHLNARLDAKQSYKEYWELLQRQREVVSTNADELALRYGLTRFSRLRGITLTPAAHGRYLRPFYETPMIRDLPYGFIYPIPSGWPNHPTPPGWSFHPKCFAAPWDNDEEKDKWRGFRLITRVLAQHLKKQPAPANNIAEFVVETRQLQTGLNCRVFDEPNDEYNDLVTILRQPGFSLVDLALLVGGQEHGRWPSFNSTLLRQALAQASDLHHVSLSTNVRPTFFCMATTDEEQLEQFVPLRTIFPVEVWSNLRHFGLVRFVVRQSHLLALLAALPPTLRSVELSYLYFLEMEGSYGELFVDVRDQLGWRQRPVAKRPRITVSLDTDRHDAGVTVVSLDREVEEFVYDGGENPFGDLGEARNQVRAFWGIGTLRDPFEPAYERPNILD